MSPLHQPDIALPSGPMPVVAIRANDIAFTGLLRGIAAGGGTPISVIYDWEGAGLWHSTQSVYCNDPIHIANPFSDEAQAVADLITLGKATLATYSQRVLVLPSSDTAQSVFLNHEAALSPYFVMMGDNTLASYRSDMTDKGDFFEALQATLTEVSPKTLVCRSNADIDAVCDKATYPAIVKPTQKDYGQSFYRANQGKKVAIAHNATELSAELTRLLPTGALLVQEKIEFDSTEDEIPFYAMVGKNGHIRVAATGIKRCIQPPQFGTATMLELSWHPELLPLAQRIATAIGWRGTLMIEFIRDTKDDRWKVIEINTRPWLFHDFYRQHGLPFVPFAVLDSYDALPDNDDNGPITPNALLGDSTPTHIDLATLCHHPADNDAVSQTLQQGTQSVTLASMAHFIEQLHAQGADISLTYSDAGDPGPLTQALTALATQLKAPLPELHATLAHTGILPITNTPGAKRVSVVG